MCPLNRTLSYSIPLSELLPHYWLGNGFPYARQFARPRTPATSIYPSSAEPYNRAMRQFFCLLVLLHVCAAQEVTFRDAVNLVPITCTVTDRDGRPIQDMGPEDFFISDDQRPRSVKYIWRESDLPLTIGLIVDVSGTQAPFVHQHLGTISRFLEQVVRPQDQGFLVAVGEQAWLITDLTHSVEQIRASLAKLNPRELFRNSQGSDNDFGGPCADSPRRPIRFPAFYKLPDHWWCGTLLWNGLYSSARLEAKVKVGQKALLVVTDGLDEGSSRTLSDAIEAAQTADAIVYALHHPPGIHAAQVFGPFRAAVKRRQTKNTAMGEMELMRLADQTGGREYEDPGGDPTPIFSEIERDLRSQYVLAFSVAESERDGKFHALDVRSKRPGLTVHARKQYFAMRNEMVEN